MDEATNEQASAANGSKESPSLNLVEELSDRAAGSSRSWLGAVSTKSCP
jgi:hypothetical protein